MIIGLDVGGTHTDAVLLGKSGLINEVKVPTDHSNLFHTVLTGLEKITRRVPPDQIDRVVLSTTLVTNAVIENKIPQVGMIVCAGPGIDPECFRTNHHYHVVAGAMDHRGMECKPVDTGRVKEIITIFKKEKIRYVGVVSKFSVRNPRHETDIAALLSDDFEKVFLGHAVSGYMNFPRRIATTYLNAAGYEKHKVFFEAVKTSLKKRGLRVPIHIMKADGGTMSFDASMECPGHTILSGPAASIMGSIASASDKTDSLVLDIGGTTTDMAVLTKKTPLLDPVGITRGAYQTLIRALKTDSIGIGGDSLVKVENRRLKIGPERIGPAMAHGGPTPTPTDAVFCLGMTDNGDREKAVAGIKPIASALGLSLKEAAFRIFDLACRKILVRAEEMIRQLNEKPVYTVHELKQGFQVKPQEILVSGGPAPFFADHLAELSGLKVGIVPQWKVANAVGAALARTTCDLSLFADTYQGIVRAPEEDFSQTIGKDFTREDAVQLALDLLAKKALERGAAPDDLDMEVLEVFQFNMVRGFSTQGKNIRVKVQVKPGWSRQYKSIGNKIKPFNLSSPLC